MRSASVSHHHFRLRVENSTPCRDCACKSPKKTFVPAAEREKGHRGGHADIDADVCRRPLRGGIAVRAPPLLVKMQAMFSIGPIVHEPDGLVDSLDMGQAQHGTEYFDPGQRTLPGECRQARREKRKIAVFVAPDLFAPAVHDQPGALFSYPFSMSPSMRCLLCPEMTGPICTSSSRP